MTEIVSPPTKTNRCDVVYYSVPADLSGGGTGRAVAFCRTHSMDCGPIGTAGQLCPLGRIEAATEQAINTINERLAAVGPK